MKNIQLKPLWIVLMFFMVSVVSAQNNSREAEAYMNNRVKKVNKVLRDRIKQKILDADIIEAKLAVNLGDRYNDADIATGYFIEKGKKLTMFRSLSEIISSSELIEAFSKKFTLKTEQNGIEFRSLLFALDNETRGKFFQKDSKWYFIKSEFFGDVSGYEVTADAKGHVTSIAAFDKKMELPDQQMGSASNILFKKSDRDYLSAADKKLIKQELGRAVVSYVFRMKKIDIPGVELNLNIYDSELEIQTKEYGVISASKYSFVLLAKDGKYSTVKSKSKIMDDKLFADAIKEKYNIKNNAEARVFQDFLDILRPAKEEVKEFYKKEDIWFFVRKKKSDNLYAYMVKTTKNGDIKYMDYSEINDERILKFKMKDSDFKVDYAFKLITPGNNKITLKESDEIPVKITFNADAVNASGAWILTRVDGKSTGMMASTSMESPFTDEIPAKYLGKGTHTVEYLLVPPGQKIDNPYGKVTLEVTVK